MIVLIGPMGAGKTTVGRALSQRLAVGFVDLDKQIEQAANQSITKIFATEGEAGFRKRESAMLRQYQDLTGAVLATGGGAILSAQNRELIRRGIVVYLHATPVQQYERIRNRSNRPNFDAANPLDRLSELMETRMPLYRSEADLTVRTDGKLIDTVAQEIEHYLLAT